MIANSAFAVGLVHGLEARLDDLLAGLTFGHARRNFYEAAQHGLDAKLVWSDSVQGRPGLVDAKALLPSLLQVAQQGLESAGVLGGEAAKWLAIVALRVERGVTGASWQARLFEELRGPGGREAALIELFARYQELARSAQPVHQWPER
jgi:hypothetical protein